jgi:hypothetical protein
MLASILALVSLLRADEPPEPVAMVLTVQGPLKLRRMDLLRPGDEVPVPPLGGVQILFLRDGHKETLKPGFTIRITDSGGAPAEAVQREKTALPKTQLNGLRTLAASARAGVARIRDVRAPPLPEAPINDATVLSDRPTFVWAKGENAGEYVLQLFPGDTVRADQLLWSERLRKPELAFPKGRQGLERGETYTWRVLSSGKNVITQGRLTVATKSQARDFEPVQRLAGSKEVSDRLLAAMLFEASHVYDESNRLFESLAKEMPAEPWVLLASARHLGLLGRTDEAASLEKKALMLAERGLR